jgi:hypothetical protein
MGKNKHGLYLYDESENYIGLIGAVIQQAVSEYKIAYKKLSKDNNEINYGKFVTERLFFINKCNGYIDEELSTYVYERAIKEAEEQISEQDVIKTNNYIKKMDKYHNF